MRCPSCGFPVDQQNLTYCPQCGRVLVSRSELSAPSRQPPQYDPYPPFSSQTPQQPDVAPIAGNMLQQSGYPPTLAYGGYPNAVLAPLPERKRRTGLIVGVIAAVVVVLAACTGGTLVAIHSLRPVSAATRGPSASPTITASKVYSNTFASNADDWAQIPQHCFLATDGYHAAGGYYCTVPVVEQDNVDISVKVQQVGGPTNRSYGLAFRQQDKDNYYAFMILSVGEWVFIRCVKADCTTPVYFTATEAIRTGLGIINTIEVRATGSHFAFLVNGIGVGTFVDTTFTFGKVSLIATGSTIDCAFTDLVITRPD
jgi:hypothetical protein